MKIIQDIHAPFECTGPVVFCLGVFDGVHKGHQYLISRAKRLGGTLVLFSLKKATNCICTAAHKERLLAECGVDRLIHVPFTDDIKNLSAQSFLELINDKMEIRNYVICEDLSFGLNREGNCSYLVQEADRRGQAVHCFEKVDIVSSTRIRAAIEQADFAQASWMMGRPYSIYGGWEGLCLPPPGVYNVMIGQVLTQVVVNDSQLHFQDHFVHTQDDDVEIYFTN
jgi:riboflavin kinase / FMN adenylyltransferase